MCVFNIQLSSEYRQFVKLMIFFYVDANCVISVRMCRKIKAIKTAHKALS